mgnify:CR=1 FL=1
MWYSGESNVPGAPGNNVRTMEFRYGRDDLGTATPVGVGFTPQGQGFIGQPGGIGNEAGLISEAPAVRRDMQGTQLVPDPRNPGKFIHPNILQNPGYEQRYRDASESWMRQGSGQLPNVSQGILPGQPGNLLASAIPATDPGIAGNPLDTRNLPSYLQPRDYTNV